MRRRRIKASQDGRMRRRRRIKASQDRRMRMRRRIKASQDGRMRRRRSIKVSLDERILNGDVLTFLVRTNLNSAYWLACMSDIFATRSYKSSEKHSGIIIMDSTS